MLVLKKTEGKLIYLSEVISSEMNAKSWFTRDFIDNLQELSIIVIHVCYLMMLSVAEIV